MQEWWNDVTWGLVENKESNKYIILQRITKSEKRNEKKNSLGWVGCTNLITVYVVDFMVS